MTSPKSIQTIGRRTKSEHRDWQWNTCSLGRTIPERTSDDLNDRDGPGKARALAVPDVSAVSTALWLTLTVLIAALAYYFLGYDQGAVSVFGSDTHIHEFIHDSRHFLGFPATDQRTWGDNRIWKKFIGAGLLSGLVAGIVAYIFRPHLHRAAGGQGHRLRGRTRCGRRGTLR